MQGFCVNGTVNTVPYQTWIVLCKSIIMCPIAILLQQYRWPRFLTKHNHNHWLFCGSIYILLGISDYNYNILFIQTRNAKKYSKCNNDVSHQNYLPPNISENFFIKNRFSAKRMKIHMIKGSNEKPLISFNY